jgi:hypothetical protein
LFQSFLLLALGVRLVRMLVGRLRLLLSGVRMLMSLGRVFAVRLGNVFAKLGRYIMFVSSHCEASSIVSSQLATTCIVPRSFLKPSDKHNQLSLP